MRYPEGEIIQIGDLVWWDEGGCIGFIEEIMETKEGFEKWGLSKPSLAFTSWHPFETKPINVGAFVISEDQIEDEGIGLLTEDERSELEWAINQAKSMVAGDLRELHFRVEAIMDMDRKEEDWYFYFEDLECNGHSRKPCFRITSAR